MELALGIAGVGVGHWTDVDARTGCTVIVFPEGTVASGEVRGGAPATRELALLDPVRTVATVDAVVLTGGSAFGLASADGVVDVLARAGRGFETRAARVPIVVALGLYDLGVGRADVRPGPAHGMVAAQEAMGRMGLPVAVGLVGAGTGATLGKWRGADSAQPGGLGIAIVRRDDVIVAAIVAVNAVGEIDDGTAIAAIAEDRWDGWPTPADDDPWAPAIASGAGENTTIGVVITNAVLDKVGCHLVAQGAHNGLARAVVPSHTRADGDAFVAAATGTVEGVPADVVRLLATVAVERAVRSAPMIAAGRPG